MVKADLYQQLPTSEELPCSDDTPVDNEDQNFVPNVLLFLLTWIWQTRQDWYFGVDMGIYHTTGSNLRVPVIPDGFLSVGVERRKKGKSRRSYVMWEENNVPPALVLEMVSHTPGGEYAAKMDIYTRLGVLYYIIYNPDFWQRDQHQPFEVYKLIEGTYQLQQGEPFWMPEVGLGIGRVQRTVGGIPLELLSWYNQQGDRYLSPEEREEQARQQADQAQQQADQAQQQADQAQQAQLEAIPRLLQMGLSIEQIAEALSLPLSMVEEKAR
jgi:Uma2 family endonuclease